MTAGQREVRFRFQRWTRPRIAGWLLTALACAAILALCAPRARPYARAPEP